MSFAHSHGARIYWRRDGRAGKPVIILVNSLGSDHAMWDPLVPLLADRFDLVRMDTRGHGASDATPGEYSLALLGADVLAVLDAAGVAKATLCGLSLGGMTGQWLALNHPDRIEALILCNTSSHIDPSGWAQRIALVQDQGMSGIVDMALQRFFSDGFRAASPATVDTARATLLSLDPVGYAGCCAAIRDMKLFPEISAIKQPVLVINGARDISTPPAEHGEVIARTIPGAKLVSFDTAHIGVLEAPRAFASAIIGFLSGQGPAAAEARETLFQDGLVNRRKVLGDAWVETSLAKRNSFNGEFQELITRTAWSEVWGRPGLDHRTRRLLVLATTIALGRWEEFRLHTRAGLEQNGFTVEELKETLMQSAVYAGVPAANTAFHHANELLQSLGRI